MSEQDTFIIYGRNPILDKLNQNPEQVSKLFLKEGIFDSQIKLMQTLCSENKIPISVVPGRKLAELAGKVNDQGVVAMVSPIAYTDFEVWRETIDLTGNPVVLALSEIEDPGNFGAIIRSATASGVSAILVPKHRQVPVTSTVMKASAGTAGLIPLIRVTNLNQSISELKDAGFWATGLDSNGEETLWQADFKRPLLVVIGSEGKGIREGTLKLCDIKLNIPMSNDVESLNASVATALVLFEIIRQRVGS